MFFKKWYEKKSKFKVSPPTPPSPAPHTPSPTSTNPSTVQAVAVLKTPQAPTINPSSNKPNASSTVNVSNYIKELEISEGQLSSCLKWISILLFISWISGGPKCLIFLNINLFYEIKRWHFQSLCLTHYILIISKPEGISIMGFLCTWTFI